MTIHAHPARRSDVAPCCGHRLADLGHGVLTTTDPQVVTCHSGAVISWSSPRPVPSARPHSPGRGEPSQSRRSEAPCVPPRATDAEYHPTGSPSALLTSQPDHQPAAVPAPAPPPRGRGGIHRMSTAQMWDAGIVTLMLGVMLLAVIVLYVAVGYPLGLGVS